MKNRQMIGNLLGALLELTVGVLLLISPEGFTTAIIQSAGVCLTAVGLWSVIGYFRKPVREAVRTFLLAKGLAALAMGLFCVFNAAWFIAAFPVLAVLYGLVMLAGAFVKVQQTADLLRMKQGKWYVAAVGAGVSLIGAAVILMNPIGSIAALWVFTGVVLIAEAVVDAAAAILNRGEKKAA